MNKNNKGIAAGLCIGITVIAGLIVEITSSAASSADRHPGDLGNGIAFPFGQELKTFKQTHPGQDCVETDGNIMCGTEHPRLSDCPTSQMCQSAYFYFTNGTMNGFSVQFEKGEWEALYQSSEKIYGVPRIKEIGPSPTASLGRTSEWKVKGGYLIFMKMYGPDFYGREIKRPFTIIFDQKAE